MKSALCLLVSIFLLGLTAAVLADEEDTEHPVPQSLDELRAAITGIMEEYDVPAVGIATVASFELQFPLLTQGGRSSTGA